MKLIDSFLNKITSYKLTLYYLIGFIALGVIFSFFGILKFNSIDLLINLFGSIFICYLLNLLFAKVFNVTTNAESSLITALILTLISPVIFPSGFIFISVASFLAIFSKYAFSFRKHNIFNPAAIGVLGAPLITSSFANWWIGNPIMSPFLFLGGIIFIRKIERQRMIFYFYITFFLILGIVYFIRTPDFLYVILIIEKSFFYSPLLFFSIFMLTEPLTSPTRHKYQIYYGIFTAIMFATPQIRFLNVVFTPEQALVLGNLFSFFINPKARYDLFLKEKRQVAINTFEFIFQKPNNFSFIPGQYMEWTLKHSRPDNRGNRRYFSLSSNPQINEISISVKFNEPSSSFKKELSSMEKGDKIIASDISGDFILPKNLNKKIVFLAGGIGVAPFKSMISFCLEKNIKMDIICIYINRHLADIAFSDLFETARSNGIKTIYSLTDLNNISANWQGEKGYITPQMIEKYIPDYKEREFYISGPNIMVYNSSKILSGMGIKSGQIIRDFFPGY